MRKFMKKITENIAFAIGLVTGLALTGGITAYAAVIKFWMILTQKDYQPKVVEKTFNAYARFYNKICGDEVFTFEFDHDKKIIYMNCDM